MNRSIVSQLRLAFIPNFKKADHNTILTLERHLYKLDNVHLIALEGISNNKRKHGILASAIFGTTKQDVCLVFIRTNDKIMYHCSVVKIIHHIQLACHLCLLKFAVISTTKQTKIQTCTCVYNEHITIAWQLGEILLQMQ